MLILWIGLGAAAFYFLLKRGFAMFYYLSGTVAHVEPYLAVIDCGGVGYACHASQNTIGKLKIGAHARLLTYLNVREDIFELYGFIDEEEQSCFKMMLWNP